MRYDRSNASVWAGLIGIACGWAALQAPPLAAHESPEHVIARFTALIEAHGPSPLLLVQRAVEYRFLAQVDKAEVDLRHALRLDPKSVPVRTELVRVLLDAGRTGEGLEEVRHALRLVPTESGRAALYLLRAEIHCARQDATNALADCDRAFGTGPQDLDSYLLRGLIQRRLGRHAEAVAGLADGFARTGSAVLEAQWTEALIEAGQAREALERIEPHLAAARLRSSWLLRRAQARLALKQDAAARADLGEAEAELNQRLQSAQPDLTLIADRGLCRALLGRKEAAREDLFWARQLHAEGWVVERLARLVETGGVSPASPAVRSAQADRPAPR